MSLQGVVTNGQIALENGVQLPEGTRVEVHIQELPAAASPLAEMLLKHAGKAQGLPEDSAAQHDHYLYGTSKR